VPAGKNLAEKKRLLQTVASFPDLSKTLPLRPVNPAVFCGGDE